MREDSVRSPLVCRLTFGLSEIKIVETYLLPVMPSNDLRADLEPVT